MERDNDGEEVKVRFVNFNSHAHVERDALQENYIKNKKHFNSHAHVERDSYARNEHHTSGHFNSHAHVERDACNIFIRPCVLVFQLTRSRGA